VSRAPVSRRHLMRAGLTVLTGTATFGLGRKSVRGRSATSVASPAASPAEDRDRRIIEHAAGTTTITGTPTRIVALDWRQVEDLLALGIQPVGIADIEGYHQWVGIPVELDPDVVDVGTTAEPGLESIAALEPDLILATELRHEAIASQLASIAPPIIIPSYDSASDLTPLEHLHETFLKVATAVNRVATAEELLAKMTDAFASAEAALDDAGLHGEPFIAALGFSSEQVPTLTVWTNESLIGATINELGLVNAWEQEESDMFGSGYSQVAVEGFVDVPEGVHFFYQTQDADNIFENELADDLIWSTLSFVEEGRLYRLPGDIWLDGGVLTVQRLMDEVVEALIRTGP
jgi:ABC-type Fe3+-hydroxamate transport system substrate-binding protein